MMFPALGAAVRARSGGGAPGRSGHGSAIGAASTQVRRRWSEQLERSLHDAVGQLDWAQLPGVEHDVVDRQVLQVEAVEGQVAGPLDVLALVVLGPGLGDVYALAGGHPLGAYVGIAVDPRARR